jgi:hypothetical protein
MLGIIAMFLMYNVQMGLNFIIVFGVSLVFFILSNKKKNDVVLGQMGIDISDDYFKQKIKDKFNF